jgi:hypothetical protein
MSTSYEKSTFKSLKRHAAVGAVSLVAAMGPGVANAAAVQKNHQPRHETPAQVEKTHLQKAAAIIEARMLRFESVAFLRGDVVIQESLKDQIDPQLKHGVALNIKNPFLVDLRQPNLQEGFKGIEVSGDYAIGFMRQTGDKPKVTLVKYDQNRMTFIPEAGNAGPNIQYALFQQDKIGGIDLQNPLDSYDDLPHGGPLTDAAGNPEPIGLAYMSMK